MYEVNRHVRENLGLVTYSRSIQDGLAQVYIEAGAKEDYNTHTSRVYFCIKNNNPNAVQIQVVPIGVNGSDGFEITMNFRASIHLMVLALKFIRKTIIDCVKGKIY